MRKRQLLAFCALTCLCQFSLADEISVERIMSCTKIEGNSERLACFDSATAQATAQKGASQEVVEADAEPNLEAPVAPDQQNTTTLPDDIGGGEFENENTAPEKSYRGRLTACKQASDRRWFYIFENGQVWKQVDRRKRRHRDCDSFVTLTEDNFGYTMVIDGQDSKIRVDRRR